MTTGFWKFPKPALLLGVTWGRKEPCGKGRDAAAHLETLWEHSPVGAQPWMCVAPGGGGWGLGEGIQSVAVSGSSWYRPVTPTDSKEAYKTPILDLQTTRVQMRTGSNFVQN